MTPSLRIVVFASCASVAGLVGWPAPLITRPLAQANATPQQGLALSTFSTSDFIGSGQCAACHSGLRDPSGTDVSINTHWRSTMMAQSARDPLWQAKVSAEVARTPALRAVIEAKCASCHTPMARTQALADGTPVTLLDQGVFDASHPLHAAAMDGVACALCHQVESIGLGTLASYTGGYHVDTRTNAPDRRAFGPFAAPFTPVMRNTVGFTPLEGAHVTSAGLCGTCHTLYTPIIDDEGTGVGTFPEQTPYLEWQHSAFGDGRDDDRSCQSCHMPPADGAVVISNRPGGRALAPRQPFGQHHFVGGNAFMLQVLERRVDELGLTASGTELAWTARRASEQLSSRTADIAIEGAERTGGTLGFTIDVRSLAGHKFPTGFPARRAWLHVTLWDAHGQMVFESGRPEANGSIVGNDADEDAKAVEPHYERIVRATEVQIYEAVMADTDGATTYTLLRAATYAKDNRLLPAGFVASTAPHDVAVHGNAAADRDFEGGGDRIEYVIGIDGADGPFRVEARLLYQPVSYRFVADLRQTPTPHVERYGRFHDDADKAPTVVSLAATSVP